MPVAMPKMIDLKLPKRRTEVSKQPTVGSAGDEYPYGMKLDFGKDSLNKMGVDISKVKINQPIMIHGIGKIIEIRQSQNSYGDGSKSIEVQLTKVAKPF
jgi:hypothetical protein